MTSLCHLYTHGCPQLKSMPPDLGKLTKLQTLTVFVAGVPGPDCSDVAELHDLNLGGQLELRQMENVIVDVAIVADLGNKKNLRGLTLRWTSVCDSKVLDNFKPHDRLQILKIYSYGGECVGMLQNMVEIHLFDCERLQFLFTLSTSLTFPRLKVLMLEYLLGFERWWEIDERQDGQTTFPVLEKLVISNCGKLAALPEAPLLQGPCGEGGYTFVHSAFPALKVLEMERLESFQRWVALEETRGEQILFPWLLELSIEECPKLTALPEAPLLREPCSEGGYRLVRSAFPALKVLKMKRLESFQRWDAATTEGEHILFPQLEKLSVRECPKITDLPEAPNLSVLEIADGKQEMFHFVDRYLSSLTKLTMNLEYTETTLEAECLPGLESLQLIGCPSLVEMFNVPASLKRMNIRSCPKLETIFGKQHDMSELVQGSSSSEAIVPTAVSELSSSPMNHSCPCLEDLTLVVCGSLPAVLNLPPSLKTLEIIDCSSIQVLSCQLCGLQKPEAISRRPIRPEPPAAAATAAREHLLPPHLECLVIRDCAGMLGGTLRLPAPLKRLEIIGNSRLTSLESLSAKHPPSMESLWLERCGTLASLPNEAQVYSSLRHLEIIGCPAIKKSVTVLDP